MWAPAMAEEQPRPLAAAMLGKEGQDVRQRLIAIDFDNVDIHLLIKYISEVTGNNFVVDKAVQGNVTIVSPTRVTPEEAYRVFESVLEVYGFTMVEGDAVVKILPAARARSQQVEMLGVGQSSRPGDRIVTQLVALKHTTPEEMKKLLTPLVAQSSVVIAHDPSGKLIVTETRSNLKKLLDIIGALDIPGHREEVAVIPLKHGSAESLGKVFASIYGRESAGKKGEEGRGSIRVVPYERINALVVLAESGDLVRIRELVATLDGEMAKNEGNIHVYYLQNATSAELAKVLNGLSDEGPAAEEGGKIKARGLSGKVRIQPDEETNSLVITADKDDYAVLEQVIKKLDIPRRMVYLEALILEVDTEKSFDVGVQWEFGGTFSSGEGAVVGGYSAPPAFGQIATLASTGALPAGLSVGVLKQGITIGSVTFPNIAAILRAYKSDTDINIISTPQILTTDNKKAEISVGENVPYITSRNTSAGEQDYTQYEYKDVATKLSIVPHINQAGTLRLEVATEVVRIKENNADTPTTFKRTASTTVVLNDNETVVIGGIIGHDSAENEWKIPLLGDIPGLGWLFKTKSSSSAKTNMFIFITPRIVRNPAELSIVTAERERIVAGASPTAVAAHGERRMESLLSSGYGKLTAGDLVGAREIFYQVLAEEPNNPFALFNLGTIFEKEDNPQAALQMYRAVIASGSAAVAGRASDGSKRGASLLRLARENIERLERASEGR
jgi:general secretion pathway protein D